MSRRKQARPIRVLEPEDALQPGGTAEPAEPGTSILGAISESSCSASDDEDMEVDPNAERSCRRCKVDFTNQAAYVAHKPTCVKPTADEEEALASSGDEVDDDKRDGGELLKRRRLQDAENNNGADLAAPGKHTMDAFEDASAKLANVMGLAPLLNLTPGVGSTAAAPGTPAAALASLAAAGGLPGASGLFANSVTLEALQNTKVAVAQFAATALANSANNPAALQELAVLQSTLYTLQHQQMLQMNLIQQLQQQLTLNHQDSKEGSPVSPASIPRTQQDELLTPPSPPISIPSSLPLSSANVPLHSSSYLQRERERERQLEKERILQPSPSSQGTTLPATKLSSSSSSRLSMIEPLAPKPPANKESPRPAVPSPTSISVAPSQPQVPHYSGLIQPHPLHHQTGGVTGCSISASLAASIITNTEPLPSLDEPNSLEMLQRRAQEVLDNASQGLLAGNLADELAFRGNGGSKGKNGDGKRGNEPFFKHRCRYCGKVFGSDSALQIHIRSHTGERPFKCNVCGSRFTTKGNLKVHFQRHTSKFPHIKMNPNPIPEHLDKYHPPLLAQLHHNNPSSSSPPLHSPHPIMGSSLPPFPPPQQAPSHPPSIPIPSSHHFRANSHPLLNNTTLVAPANLQIPPPPAQPAAPPPPQSQHLPQQHHLKRELYQPEQDVPENLSKPQPRPSSVASSSAASTPPLHARVKAEAVYSDDDALAAGDEETDEQRDDEMMMRSPSPLENDRPSSEPFPSAGGADEMSCGGRSSSRAGDFSEEEHGVSGSPSGILDVDETSQRSTSAGARHELPENLMRGNTTCNICFKTFACNSALEIHYRSHTKERPFKCTICDRGFSTKGNMKQHMLTHKIRDMPQHLFDPKRSRDRSESMLGGAMLHQQQQQQQQQHPSAPLPPHPHHHSHSHHALLAQSAPPPLHMSLSLPAPPPPQMNCSNSNSSDGMDEKGSTPTPTPDSHLGLRSPDLGLRRSPPDDDIPMAKRPSGLHKHLCHVCNKNFSSSSALQIHMRTHTGDKPFKCTVCQKAFTTKGNLKVHMGTHMWNNGASRRGRRMSLDLPPIPMTPKDSEFLQRRPDLFYPYLPAPFLNGMQQKLNEISVIQSSSPGGLPSPPSSKFGPALGGYGGIGGLDKPLSLLASRSPSPNDTASPLSLVRHSSPPTPAWDMHFRRLSPANGGLGGGAGGGASPPSAPQGLMSLSPSPPAQAQTEHRGESLVA